jgi:hypothetical protein
VGAVVDTLDVREGVVVVVVLRTVEVVDVREETVEVVAVDVVREEEGVAENEHLLYLSGRSPTSLAS